MVLANQPAVRPLLRPFEPTIRAVVLGAWDDWRELAKGGADMFRRRTRANIVHDFMIQRAIASLEGISGVNIIHRDQTTKFLFEDEVLLRFKKGNAMGFGSNIETKAVLDFIDPMAVIPGLPDAQKVEVVYTLNDIETTVYQISIAARDHNTLLWSYNLEGSGLAEIVEIPYPGILPKTSVEIRPRHPNVSKGEGSG